MTSRRLGTVLLALFALLPGMASAASPETVNDFSVHALLGRDGHVSFRENILYDFGDNQRHGIYRYIPVDYRRYGARYELNVKLGDITQDGHAEPYTLSSTDLMGDGKVLNLRIGDPNVTMPGQHGYGIAYSTDRAITFFKDHDELYWNVTGNGWDVPIEQTAFALDLPPGILTAGIKVICYTGPVGSTEQACMGGVVEGRVEVKATRVLGPKEGLTLAVSFPKGILHEPTWSERLWILFSDNRSLVLPLIALIIMYWLWSTRGRDPELRTIIPQYESPDDLPPSLVQAIASYGHSGDRGVTATILDLARRGYLHIVFEDGNKTFSLKRIKPADDRMSPIEKELFVGLFEKSDIQSVSGLQASMFYRHVAAFKQKVHAGIEDMDVFEELPEKVRGRYVLAAIAISGLLYLIIGRDSVPVDLFATLATGAVIMGFGWVMPRRTVSGTRLEERIEGFKLFLSVTETDRVAFHDAPERRPEQFTEFLPYAIAFGIEAKWAEQFKNIDIPPPGWAEGYSGTMNAIAFSHGLSTFHSSASSGAYAPMSSGGSGFGGGSSGGGGGGGGGGSW